jgi:hypothetical protein
MNANITRFEGMTVKALREIAKRMGFKGYSKLRKAVLVDMLAAQVVYAEFKARKEDAAMNITPAKISLMDYPVPYGRPVTQAHVKICQTRGHVSYVKDGIDQGICPRCGEITTSEEQIDPAMVVHYGSLIKGVACNSNNAQISDGDITLVTCEACIADSEEKEMGANSAVIEIANSGINALTPVLATAKATFENIRDHGTDADIEIAYQAYCDITRAIEELTRTIGYAESN